MVIGWKRKLPREFGTPGWAPLSPCPVRLPDDLLEEIVVRLPPESVATFRCVSKRWLRRLSQPRFLDKYRSRNTFVLGFLYNLEHACVAKVIPNISRQVVELPLRMGAYVPLLVPSTNYVMYYRSDFEPRSASNPCLFHLVDPAGDKFGYILPTPLPPLVDSPASNSLYKRFLVFGLAWDFPSFDNYYSTAFAFCEVTDAVDSARDVLINKFCFHTRCWSSKVFRNVVPEAYSNFVLTGQSVYLNGSIHWLSSVGNMTGILGYSPARNTVSFMEGSPPPPQWASSLHHKKNTTDHNGYLGESNGRLVYIRVTGDAELTIWTLRNYDGALWCPGNRVRIEVSLLPASLIGHGSVIYVKDIPDGRNEGMVVYLRVKKTIFFYNCSTRKFSQSTDEIDKRYGHQYNNLFPDSFGPIVPYCLLKAPIRGSIQRIQGPDPNPDRQASSISVFHDIGDPSRSISYNHYGVTELIAKYGDNPLVHRVQSGSHAHFSSCEVGDAAVYSDLLRLEAGLYGKLTRPPQQC